MKYLFNEGINQKSKMQFVFSGKPKTLVFMVLIEPVQAAHNYLFENIYKKIAQFFCRTDKEYH